LQILHKDVISDQSSTSTQRLKMLQCRWCWRLRKWSHIREK